MNWLTVKEVAEHLKLGVDKVYKLIQSGQIPSAKLGGQWRCSQELLDLWALSKTNLFSIKQPSSIPESSKFDGFAPYDLVRDTEPAPYEYKSIEGAGLEEVDHLGRELTALWEKESPEMIAERLEEKIKVVKRLQDAFRLMSTKDSKD